jgi:hypothetical protein
LGGTSDQKKPAASGKRRKKEANSSPASTEQNNRSADFFLPVFLRYTSPNQNLQRNVICFAGPPSHSRFFVLLFYCPTGDSNIVVIDGAAENRFIHLDPCRI